MIRKISVKEIILLLFAIFLGSVFLLSSLGKYFDLVSFKKTLSTYGVPSYLVYVILFVEFFFSICFMLLFLLKKISIYSILFFILMTISYYLGYFFYGISSCNCFGAIDFLNTENLMLFTIKNSILITISIYIFKNYKIIKNHIRLKRFVTLLMSLILVFLSLKYNEYYIDNYGKNKIGLPLKEFDLKIKEIDSYEYLFIFSPTCKHCKEAIPNIISLTKKYSLKLVGITLNSMDKEFNKMTTEFNINFKIIKIENKLFSELTKIVPVIYQIKNDTIQNCFNPKKLLTNIISTEKLNLTTHYSK